MITNGNADRDLKNSGFTIVELLLVVVVIAILAAISVVAYGGIQQRANFSRAKTDVKYINTGIQQFYVLNGAYPNTNGTWRYQSGQGDNFIPGLAPDIVSSLPQDNLNTSSYSYIYRSNGTDYKLLRHTLSENSGGTGLPAVERSNNPLIDANRPTWAWGYWSNGATTW